MQVELSKPELQKFITDQVAAGVFPSANAAIEAAVEQMMQDPEPLDDDTINALNRADAQYDAGEFVEWRDVRNELRQKYLGK